MATALALKATSSQGKCGIARACSEARAQSAERADDEGSGGVRVQLASGPRAWGKEAMAL